MRREGTERVAIGLKESREPTDLSLAERFRENAQGDEPVFESIAGAGRRLSSIGQNPPSAIGGTGDVGRITMEPECG